MGSVNSCFSNKQSNNGESETYFDMGAQDRNNNVQEEEDNVRGSTNLNLHPVPHPNLIVQLLLENGDMNTSILPSHLRTGDGPPTPIPFRSATSSTPIPSRNATAQPSFHGPLRPSHPEGRVTAISHGLHQQATPHFPELDSPVSHLPPLPGSDSHGPQIFPLPGFSQRSSYYRRGAPWTYETVQDPRRLFPNNRVPGFNWSPRPSPLASPTYDTQEQGDLSSPQVDLPEPFNLEDEALNVSGSFIRMQPEDQDVELTQSTVPGELSSEDGGDNLKCPTAGEAPSEEGASELKCPKAGEAPSVEGVCDLKCPVCLDGISMIKSSGRSMMSTVCGHIFCSSCLPACIRNNHSCPTCRMTLWEFDIHPIFI